MPKPNSSMLMKLAITGALCLAAFGSFRLAQAMTNSHVDVVKPMEFPKDLGDWMAVESPMDISKPEVVGHRYVSSKDIAAAVIVRRNAANAVLHDLSSCLINAQANPTILNEVTIQTSHGPLHCELISLTLKEIPRLALVWFQYADESAKDRWSWRLCATTSARIREAAQYYQAEVSIKKSGDEQADLSNLKNIAVEVFEELQTR